MSARSPEPAIARPAVSALFGSQIREVANAGLHDPDVLPFWFGEPDQVTPGFVREAAMRSLERGETFYTHNFGIPELREAIATYVSRLHAPVGSERVAVTASGMSALMLAVQALVAPSDRVVAVTPLWPNLTEIPRILSGDVARVPLRFGHDGWALDADRLLDALTPNTRAVMINSPNNPTGWTIDAGTQQAVLDRCRKHGIWIIADDVYERLHYPDAAPIAPSFLAIADPAERLISTNSFSKAWLMTGWRLGWMIAPAALMSDLGKLIEYNTSCSPVFVQRAGVAAIVDGETTVLHARERLRRARDLLVANLAKLPGVEIASPPGAMYAFFRVDRVESSLEFCKRLVVEAKLGLAPGSAFGPEGDGFVRWCFAADDARLVEGIGRLARFLQSTSRAA